MSFWKLHRLMKAFMLVWLGCTVQGQRLAAQKCLEYQNATFEQQSLIVLTAKSRMIHFPVFNCTSTTKLIVGGEEAKTGEFPHHALLGFQQEDGNPWDYEFRCGGTLISEQHVLTAAHCLEEEDPEVVRLGEYNTELDSSGEIDCDIDSIRVHPSYSPSHSYHDIALIKLQHPIKLSKHIRPACLWQTEERNVSSYIATGFGHNETFSTTLSTVMMKVELDEFPASDCGNVFKSHRLLKQGMKDGQLCVGSRVEGRDTCQGDSGGPLQVVTNAKRCTYAVVGITSTGGICGIANAKAIYTKVSHYIDWIEDNLWGANSM